MRKRFSEIRNSNLVTVDGQYGRIVDLLIEDDLWVVRYLVVRPDSESGDRKVLVSPAAISEFREDSRAFATALNSQQLDESPLLDGDQPVSRQYEEGLVEHFGWPIYWLGRMIQYSSRDGDEGEISTFVNRSKSYHLRSANEVCDYQIRSDNGHAGIMRDLVIQLESWKVEYATADSSSWIPVNSAMIPTEQIRKIDWSNQFITVDLDAGKAGGSNLPFPPTATGNPCPPDQFGEV